MNRNVQCPNLNWTCKFTIIYSLSINQMKCKQIFIKKNRSFVYSLTLFVAFQYHMQQNNKLWSVHCSHSVSLALLIVLIAFDVTDFNHFKFSVEKKNKQTKRNKTNKTNQIKLSHVKVSTIHELRFWFGFRNCTQTKPIYKSVFNCKIKKS